MESEAYKSLYAREKPSVLAMVLNIILLVLAAILIAEIYFTNAFTLVYISGESMMPTFNGAKSVNASGGDYVYMRNGATPDYGDVVVVDWENGKNFDIENIIKRAVAFENDEVEIREGVLYLNGAAVEESYVSPERNTQACPYYNFGPYTVEEGKVFLLGDNRNNSNDSRANGAFPLSSVLGVVPKWSIKCKGFTTAWHTYFNFKSPDKAEEALAALKNYI